MLPDERLHPLQIERFRQMSPDEKYAMLRGMLLTARRIKRAGLLHQHPQFSEIEIDRALARSVLHGRP